MSINKNMNKSVCCALFCVACDIPAGRKVCGSLGHNAKLSCTRCYKKCCGEWDQQISLALI